HDAHLRRARRGAPQPDRPHGAQEARLRCSGRTAMSLGGAVKTFRGFCVAKDGLRRWRWEERDAPTGDLAAGQILVGADKFAFTANNVTYARLGDQIAYWRFFPAPHGWGYIPVWGLGNVDASRPVAERAAGGPVRRRCGASPGAAADLQRVRAGRSRPQLRR